MNGNAAALTANDRNLRRGSLMASAHDSGFAASLSGSTPVLQQSVTGDHSGGLHFPSLLGAKPTSVETPKTTFLTLSDLYGETSMHRSICKFAARRCWSPATVIDRSQQSLGLARPAKRSAIQSTAASALSYPAKPWLTFGRSSILTVLPALHSRCM